MSSTSYLGNPKLKAANVPVEFTEDQLAEYIRCQQDPIHFIEQYVQIVHVDKGLIPFQMYPFQKNMIQNFVDNRFVICKLPRQSGKSTVIISFLKKSSLSLISLLVVPLPIIILEISSTLIKFLT